MNRLITTLALALVIAGTVSAQTGSNPTTAEGFFERGIEYHNKGDYDKAIADYTQAVKLDSKLTDAYLNRGIAYMGKGNYDNAIPDLTQAITLEPKAAIAYYYRGALYSEKKDNDRAIADYTKAIEIGMDNATQSMAYNNRGWVYFKKGDYDRTVADCTQAIKLDPKNTYAYDSRGEAYFKKGDYDRSIADYGKALGMDADYPNVKTINDNLATIASTDPKTEQKIAALEALTGCKALIPVTRLTSADKANPKMPYSNVGAAVYKELAVARFLNTAAAVSKYEAMLTFITGRGNAARAEIEAFYRQNVGALIAAEVDAQFNRLTVSVSTLTEIKQVITKFYLTPNQINYSALEFWNIILNLAGLQVEIDLLERLRVIASKSPDTDEIARIYRDQVKKHQGRLNNGVQNLDTQWQEQFKKIIRDSKNTVKGWDDAKQAYIDSLKALSPALAQKVQK